MKINDVKTEEVTTYEEAAQLLENIGILPLAPLIPDHPSLNGLTKAENWHTGTDLDPWLWRVRFPVEGTAAYGKFMKKKALLVSKKWFPVFLAAMGSKVSLRERYNSGLCSREALELLSIIQENEGVETRGLRSEAKMKEKEKKRAFDNAVTELQGSLDIVISGVKEKQNADGEKNGWSSTSYETTRHWMEVNGISPYRGSSEEAVEWLKTEMENIWSPSALAWMHKACGWK